jgi:hypothetical protein
MEQMTPLKRSQELMRRVREILLGHHEREEMVIPPVYRPILQLYSRMRSLLEGTCLLLDAGLPEEAIILGREMFTDSLYLMKLAKCEPDRAALILELLNEVFAKWEDLERQELSIKGLPRGNDSIIRDFVAKNRKKIEAYKQREGISERKRFGSEKQLAKEYGRLDEYLDFACANAMVHQAIFAQQTGRTFMTGDVHTISLRNPDDDSKVAGSAFVMRSALHAHKAVASIFAWTETDPDEIDGLLAEIEHLLPGEGRSAGGDG